MNFGGQGRGMGRQLAARAAAYSRSPSRVTTIGLQQFHFRVRNGNGWDLLFLPPERIAHFTQT